MIEHGVRFTLSDDSHGVSQVAYGYPRVFKYLEELGVGKLYYYDWAEAPTALSGSLMKLQERKPPGVGEVVVKEVAVKALAIS